MCAPVLLCSSWSLWLLASRANDATMPLRLADDRVSCVLLPTRSLLAYCTAVPPSRVLTVAAGMSAVTWFALNRPRSRANAVASLRRAALTTAGSTAVALWVLFVVQYGVKRWASGHPLTALAAAAASGSGGRGGTQHHGSRTVALFSMLGRGVATIDRMRQWLGLHQQQIREHGPTAAMVLVITLALWSARRRL